MAEEEEDQVHHLSLLYRRLSPPLPRLVPVRPLPRPAPPPAPTAMIKKHAVVIFCSALDFLFNFLFNLVVKDIKQISTWYSKISMSHSEKCSLLKTVNIKMHTYVHLQFWRSSVHVFVI